jgi:polysaccharide biosynthesis transport protein
MSKMSRAGFIIRYWKILIIFNFIILMFALFSASLVKKSWSANSRVILSNTSKNLNLKLGAVGDLSGGEGLVFSQQLDSRRILSSIILSDEVLKKTWELDQESDRYSKLEHYRKLFSVKPDDASTVISLSAEGDTQEFAKSRLTNLVNMVQQRLEALRKDGATQQVTAVQKELIDAERNLNFAQKELVDFQERANWVDSDSQTKELVTTLREVSVVQAQARSQYQASQARLQSLKQKLGETADQAISGIRLNENVEYQAIQQALAKLEIELSQERSTFTENAPQIQSLLTHRQELLQQQAAHFGKLSTAQNRQALPQGVNYLALQKQLVDADNDVRALQQQANEADRQVENVKASIRKTPLVRAQLAKLQRQYNNTETIHNGLTAQIQATQVNAFSNYLTIQVLDQPASASLPSGPGKRPVLLGAILASIFGSAAIVLFLENQNPLLAIADLKQLSVPVLGAIPQHKDLNPTTRFDAEPELAFQRLASTVSLMKLHHQRLMIASAEVGEGKTWVTFGLATALSRLGFRVLVIDADFIGLQFTRQVSHRFNLSINTQMVPVKLCAGLDLLSLNLPASDAAEFIARGALDSLLSRVQQQQKYDYILIDTNPISMSNETLLMTRAIPDWLIVTTLGNNKRSPFLDSIQHIHRNQGNILGLVINRTDTSVDRLLNESIKIEA